MIKQIVYGSLKAGKNAKKNFQKSFPEGLFFRFSSSFLDLLWFVAAN
jgi:hypothetical protein